MSTAQVERLAPSDELDHLKAIYGKDKPDRLYGVLTDSFNVLQNRAQMLLSLVTITLTITGFSGPKIAESSPLARFSIAFGLAFVLLSALIMISGPLRLSWCTRTRAGDIDQSIIKLIDQRNFRTKRYIRASLFLVIGLTGYVFSVISFLITG
ncbi:MAG: hypothetical protein ISR58_18960 [Anaerolineales bacterium]|nr:hypothetical protein [Chloroflexota bacterium]MBL6983263.1 hypothetical protein [Anaerolineales bacterium]